MKTSNKILIAAFLLLTVSLVVYDMLLRAEYIKGDYKKPFYNYVTLNYSNFNSVELNCSTAANVLLVQGPFKVMADPMAMDFLKISQSGKTLTINAAFSDHYRSLASDYTIYISCPNLSKFKASARYMIGKQTIVDLVALDFSWRESVIRGFTADSLNITEDYASSVELENNRLGILNAITGISDNSGSNLTIEAGNKFNKANLDIRNNSSLWIKGANHNNLNYHLADSAKLTIDGASLSTLKPVQQ